MRRRPADRDPMKEAIAKKTKARKRATPVDVACSPKEHEPRDRKTGTSEMAFARAARLFRALADVPRLKLIARLADGEWCVTELADAAQISMSTVSQQLRMLRDENLVRRRRAAKHIYYALQDEHVNDLIKSALEHAGET
jgi:DNA-binding transcriptional ArsR family regulator